MSDAWVISENEFETVYNMSHPTRKLELKKDKYTGKYALILEENSHHHKQKMHLNNLNKSEVKRFKGLIKKQNRLFKEMMKDPKWRMEVVGNEFHVYTDRNHLIYTGEYPDGADMRDILIETIKYFTYEE